MIKRILDSDTISYAMKTAKQELSEVISGAKPAALGFWDKKDLPNTIFIRELVPVFGHYYKWAIAKTPDRLVALVNAYYTPFSKEGDIKLGKALGYSEGAIFDYVVRMKYPKPYSKTKQKLLKIKATIERSGLLSVLITYFGAMFGNKILKNIMTKECFA